MFGGVKVGSNITNTDGKISLSKSNVTSALGYTPVKSVNGSTVDANGNVEIAAGGKTLIGTIVTPTSNFGSNTQTFNLPIGTHVFLRVYQNGVAGTPQGGTLTVNPCVNHGRLISATNTSDLTATKSQNASVSLYLAPNSSGSGMHYWDLHFVTCSTSVAITMKNGTGTMARTVEVYA